MKRKKASKLELIQDELRCARFALEITGRDKEILKKREVELVARVSVLERELGEARDAIAALVEACESRVDNTE